jgi:hypothetical protein
VTNYNKCPRCSTVSTKIWYHVSGDLIVCRQCANELSRIERNLRVTPRIEKSKSCCKILKSHYECLKDDPERLSTEFIKKMSQCDCDTV